MYNGRYATKILAVSVTLCCPSRYIGLSNKNCRQQDNIEIRYNPGPVKSCGIGGRSKPAIPLGGQVRRFTSNGAGGAYLRRAGQKKIVHEMNDWCGRQEKNPPRADC